MQANFKLSLTQYRTITPYKIADLNIYSIEEAIYIFFNRWKEFTTVFFQDDFIKWVEKELVDNNLVKKLVEIKNCDNFYQKCINFLTINDFYSLKEIEKIYLDLLNWEKRGQSEQFKALGDKFFKENLFQKALNFYFNAIEFAEDNPILYNNIGICYIRLGQFKLAFDYLKKAFDLSNQNIDILYNLIDVCILNDSDQFFQYLSKISECKYYYYLGEYYFFKINYNLALENYIKSYEITKDYNIIIKIVDIYIKLLDYEKALQVIDILGEDLADVLIKKSEVFEHMLNYSKAIKCLEKANYYKSNSDEIWLKLAKLYRLEHEFLKAESAIIKAKSIAFNNNQIILEQALIKKAQGKFKEYQQGIYKIMKSASENYRMRLLWNSDTTN